MTTPTALAPGQRLARGAGRALEALDVPSLEEFVPTSGLRVDLMGLAPRDELWVVEVKSSVADFRADAKWQGYLEWCDRFFWAVDADFPLALLPPESGLILCDDWGGELMRMPQAHPLAPARRRVLMRKFARHGALALRRMRDPRV